MSAPGDSDQFPGLEARRFVLTPWTEVMLASEQSAPGARQALEHLCRLYWYPLYAHIRHAGHSPHDAEDLTQEFFRLLIEKNYLGAVDRQRGKFRTFLLVAVNRFLINAHKHATRIKRGGGQVIVSLDLELAESRLQAEPAADATPDKAFDRRWAQALLDKALARLGEDYQASGRGLLFDTLKVFLADESGFGDYSEAANALGLTPSAVAVAVHRLRTRYRQLIREEISPTVADPADIENEMRHLVSAM